MPGIPIPFSSSTVTVIDRWVILVPASAEILKEILLLIKFKFSTLSYTEWVSIIIGSE